MQKHTPGNNFDLYGRNIIDGTMSPYIDQVSIPGFYGEDVIFGNNSTNHIEYTFSFNWDSSALGASDTAIIDVDYNGVHYLSTFPITLTQA